MLEPQWELDGERYVLHQVCVRNFHWWGLCSVSEDLVVLVLNFVEGLKGGPNISLCLNSALRWCISLFLTGYPTYKEKIKRRRGGRPEGKLNRAA